MGKLVEVFLQDMLAASSMAKNFDDYEVFKSNEQTSPYFFDGDTFNLIVYWMMTGQYDCLSYDSLMNMKRRGDLTEYLMIDHDRGDKQDCGQSVKEPGDKAGLEKKGNYKKVIIKGSDLSVRKLPLSEFYTKYSTSGEGQNVSLTKKCTLVSQICPEETVREFVELFADYVATTTHHEGDVVFSLEPGSSPCLYQTYLGWSTFSEFLQTCSIKIPEQVKRQNEAEGKVDLELLSWQIQGDNVHGVIKYFFHSLANFCKSRSFYADLRPKNVLLDIKDGVVCIEFIDYASERFHLDSRVLNACEIRTESLHPLSYVYKGAYTVSADGNSVVLLKDGPTFKKLSYQYDDSKGYFATKIESISRLPRNAVLFHGEKGSVIAQGSRSDFKKNHIIAAALKNCANDFLNISKFNRKNKQNGGVLFVEKLLHDFILKANPTVDDLAKVITSDITICGKPMLSSSHVTSFSNVDEKERAHRTEETESLAGETAPASTNGPFTH
jgi:hypothetical protein